MDLIQNPVYIVTQRIISPGGEMVIDYPVAVGMPNQAVQSQINQVILSLVNKIMNEQNRQLIKQGYKDLSKVSIQGWYELKTNERGILSLSIGNYTIAYPAAHGLTIIRSLTFDIITGKAYKLNELFKPESNYVKKLSLIIEKQIKERKVPLLSDFKGIRPDQDYYIADKALVVYFQLYELTPYAYGFPQFPISVYELESIIREDGPLGKMAVNT
ncbi:MAG TPA: DUF3298 domain-containing protein [Clostridiales bacterium]|nr:DUF3298 domain-containing protein [Clostridiales bacterium]